MSTISIYNHITLLSFFFQFQKCLQLNIRLCVSKSPDMLLLLLYIYRNGIILHLMGNGYYNGTLYDNTVNDTLCNIALLLDTNTHQWHYQSLGGQDIPQQIINGYAALGKYNQDSLSLHLSHHCPILCRT